MGLANDMYKIAMESQRNKIDEDLIAIIREASDRGETYCEVDYISEDDKVRLEYEGFIITEEEEKRTVYMHKIPIKKTYKYYVIDWSQAHD